MHVASVEIDTSVIIFILGVLQVLLLWFLGHVGLVLVRRARKGHELANYSPKNGWPAVALIIPVGGPHPNLERSLRSLLEQHYPEYRVFITTADAGEGVREMLALLAAEYGNLTHVIAGETKGCGQKNHNLLAALDEAGLACDVYVFCDSTHIAQPDFLRCLTGPIARGEAAFTTGYHQVQARDQGIITLAYAMSVLFMRFLQGVASFTELWGGAMAMSRQAFDHYHVAELWSRNVVDDCSLSAWLKKQGGKIVLCPSALLTTYVEGHTFTVWRAWLERQILFLKFCMPAEWLLLGLASILMAVPPIWLVYALGEALIGWSGGTAPFLALCWFFFALWAVNGWRMFMALPPSLGRWAFAYFCASVMFGLAWLGTIFSRHMLWQNRMYTVGKDGVVTGIKKV